MAKNSMSLDISGFTYMLERIQKAGGNIDKAAEKALSESAKPFYDDLKAGIKKHHETGLTEASLRDPNNIVWDGNRVTLKVGFDMSKGGLPALFVEYGTPKQAADPFIQPAITKNKFKAKKIQQQILNEILGELEK